MQIIEDPTAPFEELIEHIVNTHHAYLKRELPALSARLERYIGFTTSATGKTLPGLPEIFADLRSELETHMQKEEMILFPAIVANKSSALFAAPIAKMEAEHESAGEALRKIREITQDFAIPDYSCVTHRALMNGLQGLEQDLHIHIHLKNNSLFPRAMQLEAA